jgi:cell division protein FtsZ
MSIDGAQGVLVNVIGGSDMAIHEIDIIGDKVREAADSEANIIFGATIDEEMENELHVIALATGFDQTKALKRYELGQGDDKKAEIGSPSIEPEDIGKDITDEDEEDLEKPAYLRRK